MYVKPADHLNVTWYMIRLKKYMVYKNPQGWIGYRWAQSLTEQVREKTPPSEYELGQILTIRGGRVKN